MNLRDRLEIRALINLIISVIERISTIMLKFVPTPKTNTGTTKPPRVKPLKKIIDKIDDIVPNPWRNKNE